jgi:hypothetical protein
MARSSHFRRRTPAALFALVAMSLAAPPIQAQEPDNANVAHEARYVASPVADGLRHVLSANRYNDFLGPDAPSGASGLLAALANEAELEGHTLLATHRSAAEGMESAPAELRAGGADVLIVALDSDGAAEGLGTLGELVASSGMESRLLVQNAWSTGAGSDADIIRLQSLRTRLAEIDAHAGREVANLVPAADAVDRLRWEVALGNVPGVARQADLFTDGEGSPSRVVRNLVAYLTFTVMYRQPATGLTALVDPSDATSLARERVLQRIAWDAAAAEPASGVMVEHIWLGRSRGPHVHNTEDGADHDAHMPASHGGH